jgi:hypothetical protein
MASQAQPGGLNGRSASLAFTDATLTSLQVYHDVMISVICRVYVVVK